MKLTVITVCYNSADTISCCIESVLRQSYENIEYIIVDGNSTDNTMGIVRSYEKDFNGRLRWISESDNGLYDAMNKGISMATGDVVGILNSDDFFTTDNVLEKVAHTFIHQKTDALYGDIHYVDPQNLNVCVRYYSSAFFRTFLLRFGLQPAHPSFYCKREFFEKYGNYRLDLKIAADFELFTRFFLKNKLKAHYLKMDFVTMRTGGLSTASIKSRHTLNVEDVKACKLNDIWTIYPLVCFKYFVKIFEIKPTMFL